MSLALPPVAPQFNEIKQGGKEVIKWSPPDPSWNPWINQPTLIEGAEEYMV